jgi:hypothetical protein
VVKRLAVSGGREERADDEGNNDLLLSSDRGAGGAVMSKEEVAVGRKGSGGAWGSTSRKVVEKNKPKCRSSGGCNLVRGAEIRPSPAIELQRSNTPFSHARVRAIQGAWCFSPKMGCVSFYFERAKLSGTAPSRCIEAPRAPLERALDPGCPRRGPRGSWGVVESRQAAGATFVVGKVVLTLHPPLRPLGHNAKP